MKSLSVPGIGRDDLAAARRVLRLEAAGLERLAATLDSRLVEALDIVQRIGGRVVVTGMGKSGHVARKIASTLASTGTPALFVHPGEASHGDLGMVTASDALIALSNSGETGELADLVAHAQRYRIPLIAITGRADSTLAKAADVALVLPAAEEACPLHLAPTTSTTMMLALGDTIAVALLARQQFSEQDFHALHPGGQLGRRFIKVADIMHGGDAVPLAGRGMAMGEALLVMTQKSFGCVGIVDGAGRLIGVITDGDLRRHMGDGLLARKTAEVMTGDPRTVTSEMLAARALGLMNERKITSLFVVDDRRPVGILHIHDCLRAGIA